MRGRCCASEQERRPGPAPKDGPGRTGFPGSHLDCHFRLELLVVLNSVVADANAAQLALLDLLLQGLVRLSWREGECRGTGGSVDRRARRGHCVSDDSERARHSLAPQRASRARASAQERGPGSPSSGPSGSCRPGVFNKPRPSAEKALTSEAARLAFKTCQPQRHTCALTASAPL